MAASLVYKSPLIYELVMAALYGRHYPARYRAIAELVPERSTVLELCCGPGFLYERHLQKKQVHYTGLDSNPQFIARLKRLGAQGEVRDLHRDE
ncbi:MAG TPA: class I SAM-dependent methyltransferase, partial [Isosphaeraceae bacterium]|nr:class I SAM-dependent methyltransferase [Isosphaeraceae bacterium]